jgi:tRNA A-37 threonylcarbamoyl transferase component Bud32
VNDDTPRNPDAGPLAVLARVDQVCDRFEAAWPDPGRLAPRPRIEDYLGETPEPERSQLLTPLLALELEYRRAAGENPLLEDYRARFPDHGEVVRRVFSAPETVPPQRPANPSPPAPAAGDLSSPERFRPLRLHAEGGLGEVHLAQDCELRREVALKRIRDEYADDPDSRHRFLREAEITGGLEHPGIVPVYGLGQGADGRPYYAMRFIKGDSLKQAIERFHQAEGPKRDPGERTLALRELLGRFVEVCNAVGYAHSRGVLHRDLKPDNVMLGPYGETLVVDWGLAKPVGRPEGRNGPAEVTLRPTMPGGSEPSQMGQVIGTPAYMAPEQAAGRLDQLGPASDVYSLGATLYCLLTGKAQFENSPAWLVLPQVIRGEFPLPRQIKGGIPRPLSAICLKAMALKPEDRYASARALADDIEHWLADEPVAAFREPLLARLGRWCRRHRVLVTSVAAAALAAVVLAGVVWLRQVQVRAETAREVEQGLARAKLLMKEERWEAARGEARRAQALLEAQGGEQEHRDRIEEVLADLRMVERLEEICLRQADLKQGEPQIARADGEYRSAFRDYGINVEELEPEEAAARIRRRLIRDRLVGALDDWARVRKNTGQEGAASFARLTEVAGLADSDPWRRRLRTAKTGKELQDLASDKRVTQQSAMSLELLGSLLRDKIGPGEAVVLLRQAQVRYPGDFWINYQLADNLLEMKPPQA